ATGRHAGRYALVLRRDMGGTIHDEALTREQEYRVLAAARRNGVGVAPPRRACTRLARLGPTLFLLGPDRGGAWGGRSRRGGVPPASRTNGRATRPYPPNGSWKGTIGIFAGQ